MEPEVSSSYSDEDIVEGLKNGDPFATEILIKKHGNDLGHAIQSGCGKFPGLKNPSDIEDALQETFLKITRSINSFDPGKASFPTWATEIALNAAIDHGRKYLGWGKKGHQPKRVIWLRLEKLQQLCNDNHISEEKMSHILRSMYCTPLSRHEFKKAKLCSFLHVLTRDNKLSPVFEVGLRRALAANA